MRALKLWQFAVRQLGEVFPGADFMACSSMFFYRADRAFD